MNHRPATSPPDRLLLPAELLESLLVEAGHLGLSVRGYRRTEDGWLIECPAAELAQAEGGSAEIRQRPSCRGGWRSDVTFSDGDRTVGFWSLDTRPGHAEPPVWRSLLLEWWVRYQLGA